MELGNVTDALQNASLMNGAVPVWLSPPNLRVGGKSVPSVQLYTTAREGGDWDCSIHRTREQGPVQSISQLDALAMGMCGVHEVSRPHKYAQSTCNCSTFESGDDWQPRLRLVVHALKPSNPYYPPFTSPIYQPPNIHFFNSLFSNSKAHL